MIIGP